MENLNENDAASVAQENHESSAPPALERVGYSTDTAQAQHFTPESPALDGEADSQISERLALALGNKLGFDDVAGEWYGQAGGLWKPISKRQALRTIRTHLKRELPKGFAVGKLNAIETLLALDLLIDGWIHDRNLLPLKNGVLNVKARELRPYQRSDRFNWQLPYSYDADAEIQVVADWLRDATGNDPEQIKVIRAFAKVAIVGGDLQKFLEVVGCAGSGKSTLVRLLVESIGRENQATTDLKNLETNRFEAAGLYGKRLVVINDSSRYGGEVSTLKAITGGDPIRLEKKNQQQGQSFVFDGVVVIVSNEPIQTTDYSSGMIRRRMPVTFNNQVTDADKAKWKHQGGIENAMKQELPAFLNWVLDMSDDEVRLVIGGINGEMTIIQRQHLINTNALARWVDECCIASVDSVVGIGRSMAKERDSDIRADAINEKLYSNYESWCEGQNIHPLATNKFSDNVVDVCSQAKLSVARGRNNQHSFIKGLMIRKPFHGNHPTPITNTLNDVLSGEVCSGGGESVVGQTLDSVEGGELYTKTHSEIKPDDIAGSWGEF
jgi:putative DNA primase/helicase